MKNVSALPVVPLVDVEAQCSLTAKQFKARREMYEAELKREMQRMAREYARDTLGWEVA
jgi:hypothetical protein